MEKFYLWFADSIIASFLRHFLAILLTLAIADFASMRVFSFENVEIWAISALVAAAPPLLRKLNPYDTMEY